MSRTDPEIRAARRLVSIEGRAGSLTGLEERGLEFWVNADPAIKLKAMWDAILEAWIISGKHGPPPRFQGYLFGVGRHER